MYYICIMDIERNNAQMRKGVLELCILSIVSREDAYASDIIEKLKEARLIVVEGTLYPLLTRLKNEGLLSYRWEESTQGPPRKYYRITEQGQADLGQMAVDWKEMVEAVERLLGGVRRA
jgi:PadR family transcriptional regulator, regulatory protein PadR